MGEGIGTIVCKDGKVPSISILASRGLLKKQTTKESVTYDYEGWRSRPS